MPELPEVETIRRGLQRRILHKKIRSVEIRAMKVVKSNPKEFGLVLKGNSFTRLERRGKLLIFTLSQGKHFLLVHMKLTGQLIYQRGKKLVAGGHPVPRLTADLPHRHTHVILEFADGSRLFFNDLRKFGVMKIVNETAKNMILAAYGAEPLSKEFTWKYFQKVMGKRQTSLKAVLLNQALIAGLGNIYVDEVAWHARVRPGRRAAKLTEAELKRIFQAIPKVLQEAIDWGGTTFRHFRDSDGEKGNYTDRLRAYGRVGEKCRRLACRQAGAVLVKTVVAQRGTTYCPRCQR